MYAAFRFYIEPLAKVSEKHIEKSFPINLKRKPFDDLRVRKALAYATNRDEVVAYFGASITDPLYGPVPPYAFGALQDKDMPKELRYDYDPEKAKQLLRDLPCVSVRLFTMPFAKQPYVDLGDEPKHSMIYLYHITEKTRILKH